jgi:FSR family fosmidomycin resistance protein-like MFS transporter
MAAFILFYPASGAFVNLSQAALMDYAPARHEQNMARWTLAGSIGVVLGPLALGAAVSAGLSWRDVFLLMTALAVLLVFAASRFPFPNGHASGESNGGLVAGLREAFRALRRRDVLRWLILLQFSDLMLDILLGYRALYFVDVVKTDQAQAGLAVAVWTGVGLIGDMLLLPLLERMRGLTYLRYSAAIELGLFMAFLLVGDLPLKLVILGLLGFFNSGWYSILQAQVYTAMPGQSGTVMAIHNLFALVGGLIPLAIGLLAEQFGLNTAMWFLVLGPIALLMGLPRKPGLSAASGSPPTGAPTN